MSHNYAGADWVRVTCRCELSPLGKVVADFLGWIYGGIYHIDNPSLRKADWGDADYIEVHIPSGIATYDGDELTRLVVGAHDRCLRVSVRWGAGPGYLRLCFFQRKREGNVSERHPTIEQAIERCRITEYPLEVQP